MKPLMIIAAASLSTPGPCLLPRQAESLAIEAAAAAALADKTPDPLTKMLLERQALDWLKDIDALINGRRR